MRLELQLNLRIALLCVFVLPILLYLGFWQLDRADEKAQVLAQLAERINQPPVAVEQLSGQSNLAFTPVKLTGRFDNTRNLLLDNRIYQRQVGYHVLTPFETTAGLWVLINRGWIKAPPTRDIMPDIPPAQHYGDAAVYGQIYEVPGEAYQLEEQQFNEVRWPLVIQAVEMDKFQTFFADNLFAYEVRIDANEPSALIPNWTAVTTTPEKHVGYAVQWFSMSFALFVWFLFSQTNAWQWLKSVRNK